MHEHRTPVAVSDARVAQILAQTGHGRDLLCDGQPRIQRLATGSRLSFRLRLPSYRALPLCCIESLQVSVDGVPVPTRDAQLVLDRVPHRIDGLGSLRDVWWFILDEAEVRVPLPASLAAGMHELTVALARVEPYITAGRFTFTTRSSKRLDFIVEAVHD